MDLPPIRLQYDRGTVLVQAPGGVDVSTWPGVRFDERTLGWRATGRDYRVLVEFLLKQGYSLDDQARGWPNKPLGLKLHTDR